MYPGKYPLVFFTLIFCPLETSCTKGYCITTYRNGKLVSEGDCMSESEQNAIIKDLRAKLEKRQMKSEDDFNGLIKSTAHPTTNEESTTAAHPTTNEESTMASHPSMNDESTTTKEESTTASNPRKTGGTTPSCKDACMPSSLSNDPVVSGELHGWPENKGRCGCSILIQQRYSNMISFARNLTEYQQGFGAWSNNYWLGLDRIHVVTNRTGGVTMEIVACNKKVWEGCSTQGWKFFSAGGVHVAARSENYSLTMLDTNDEAMRQMNGSTFEVKNIEADGCNGVSGWWFGDISGDRTNGKWCNPNGPYRGAGIKWRKDRGTSSGVGNDIYSRISISFEWFTPRNA